MDSGAPAAAPPPTAAAAAPAAAPSSMDLLDLLGKPGNGSGEG